MESHVGDELGIGTMDAGKPDVGATTVEITLDNLFDDRPKEAVIFHETAIIFHQEALEAMEEHAVEDGALGMIGMIGSGIAGGMEQEMDQPLGGGRFA